MKNAAVESSKGEFGLAMLVGEALMAMSYHTVGGFRIYGQCVEFFHPNCMCLLNF